MGNGLKGTTEGFIKKAKKVHKNAYNYEKVAYINCYTPVTIICNIHGDFEQKPTNHLVGSGCRDCAAEKRVAVFQENAKKQRLPLVEFIRRANIIHNKKYDYTFVSYVSLHDKIIIICPKHGNFIQLAQAHLYNKQGCRICFEETRKDTDLFIEKAMKIHENLYDYSKTNLWNKKDGKVLIICRIHGDCFVKPSDHIDVNKKAGCPECGHQRSIDSCRDHLIKLNKPREEREATFITKAKKVHNDFYDYSTVYYTKKDEKVTIICKEHGEFRQTPHDHLSGNGCQKCARSGTSIGEESWLSFLKVKEGYRHIKIRTSKNLYFVDGLDIDKKIVYEFFGDYWHGNPEVFNSKKINPSTKTTYGYLYNKTLNKIEDLKKHGYTVVYIWENDWNKYKEFCQI